MRYRVAISAACSMLAVCSLTFAQSWIVQRSHLPYTPNPNIEFAIADSLTVWGAVANHSWIAPAGSPIVLRTTDGGIHWDTTTVAEQSTFRISMITAAGPDTAWVAGWDPTSITSGAILRTTDKGASWVKQFSAFPGSGGFPDNIYAFDSQHVVCVGDPHGGYWEIYTTTDGGDHWVRVPSSSIPAPVAGLDGGLESVMPAIGNTVWFSSYRSSVYRSTDRGFTWTVARHIFSSDQPTVPAFVDSLHGLILGGVFTGGVSVRTSDGGKTWVPFTPSSLPTGVSSFRLTGVPGTRGTYFNASDWNIGAQSPTLPGAAYSVDNGDTWTVIDRLPHGKPTFFSPTVGWTAGNPDTIYRWTGPGLVPSVFISTVNRSIDFKNVYPGTTSDTAQVVLDNWGSAPVSISSVVSSHPEFSLISPPSTPFSVPAYGRVPLKVVFSPVQAGVSLLDSISIASNDPAHPIIRVTVRGRGSAPVQPTVPMQMYGLSASASATSLYGIDLISGASTLLSSLSPPPPQAITSFTIRRADGFMYATQSAVGQAVLWRISSADGDLEQAGTIPLGGITASAFSPGGRFYAADDHGRLYRTSSPGSVDTVLVGMTGHIFTGLAFRPGFGTLYGSAGDTLFTIDTVTAGATSKGSAGRGTLRSSLAFNPIGSLYGLYDGVFLSLDRNTGAVTSEFSLLSPFGISAISMRDATTSVRTLIDSPTTWELTQNYPNPFNPTTVINFSLEKASHVELRVYDLLGRLVRTLADEERAAGMHSIIFNGTNLASGVYYYSLRAGSFTKTKALILLR